MELLTSIGMIVLMFLARAGLVVLVLAAFAGVILGVIYAARGVKAVWVGLGGTERVDQVLLRHRLSYSPGHLWLKQVSPETLRVGLDDFARRLVATPDHVELPAKGTFLRHGEDAARLYVAGRVIGIPAPVEGEVVAVNDALEETPALLEKPYSRGWLFAMRSQDPSCEKLRTARAARMWMMAEQRRLFGLAEHALGIAAADGGLVVTRWVDRLSRQQRAALAVSFLRPEAAGAQAR